MVDAEMIGLFVTESREHIENFETDVLALEQNVSDTELVNRIFRGVHSIKGGAAVCGLGKINKLSHAMENVMSHVRDGKLVPERSAIDVLLAAGDRLRAMIDDVGHSEEIDISGDLSALEAVLQGREPAAAPEPKPAPAASSSAAAAPSSARERADEEARCPLPLDRFDVDAAALEEAAKRGRFIYSVVVLTGEDMADKSVSPPDFLEKVESIGSFLDSFLETKRVKGLDDCLARDLPLKFLIKTVLEPDVLQMGLGIPAGQIKQVSVGPAESAAPAAPAEDAAETALVQVERDATLPAQPSSPAPTHIQKTEETIRVPISLLDDLMNLAGEMVLGRNQLLRIAETFSRQVRGLPAVLQNIDLVTAEVQDKVMQTRMQPIGVIFSKVNRVVRDLSRSLQKEIDLTITGEDVELDKSVIEILSDPLTHLVRNCVDHGIELPSEREREGKHRIGVINLTAEHEGGQVLVQIVDDGRGMNPEKLKRKAVEKGVVTATAAQRMSEREAFSLVFLPGFSTADRVTDVSGRGVGMDVVRANLEHLGGQVEVESKTGEGTRITLRIPLTLAIIPSMVAAAGGRRFAVPQASLEEIVRIGGDTQIEYVREAPVLRLRGKLLPLLTLTEVLKIETGPGTTAPYVLVLRSEKNRYGLAIEELVDSEEIVVKPLSSYLKGCKCYSGSTIMGDGTLAMILAVPGIAEIAELSFSAIEEENLAIEARREQLERKGETQSLLLFRNGTRELFALNLQLVTRVEKVRTAELERIGEKEFLKYQDSSMRVVRLHDFLPVGSPELETEFVHVVVPDLTGCPIGIVATEVVDVMETNVMLDKENLRGPGILGSAVIDGRLAILLDIYSLFEAADPEFAQRHAGTADVLRGKRVLLAEDTAFFQTVETEYLTAFGCRVDVAPDGVAAWSYLNRNTYDIVITDIEMPRMGGLELTRRIRASEKMKDLPVVALTTLSGEEARRKGEEAGLTAYEAKFDRERLRETLRQILLAMDGHHAGVHGPARPALPATSTESVDNPVENENK